MVGLACVSTIAQILWLSRFKKSSPSVGDVCVWAAFVVGIVLVAQTTWAIIDEGSGKHQSDIEQQSLAAIAKVNHKTASSLYLTNNQTVSHCQRGSLGNMQRLDPCFRLLCPAKYLWSHQNISLPHHGHYSLMCYPRHDFSARDLSDLSPSCSSVECKHRWDMRLPDRLLHNHRGHWAIIGSCHSYIPTISTHSPTGTLSF